MYRIDFGCIIFFIICIQYRLTVYHGAGSWLLLKLLLIFRQPNKRFIFSGSGEIIFNQLDDDDDEMIHNLLTRSTLFVFYN